VDSSLEREVKLRGDSELLERLEGEPLEERRFTSTYYDTADHRLARNGVTLRRRVEHRKSLWQLKLPRASARLELELSGGSAVPPQRMRDLLVAFIHGRDLAPVAKLRTLRRGLRLAANGGSSADVVIDEVAILDGRKVTGNFSDLEVEVVNGDEQTLEDVEQELRKAGARRGDPRPKVLRALGLDPQTAVPAVRRNASAVEHLQARLERLYEQLLTHDPGTRLGDDPEDLHQLRVATRRLRALLRAARPMLVRDWSEPLRAELKWLGDVLGPARDLDVLIEYLREEAEALSPDERRALGRAVAVLESEREEAGAALREALESERYLELLHAVERAARAPHVVSRDVSLRDLAAREFRRLKRATKSLPRNPTDAELHRVRIKGKRARYAAELAEDAAGKAAARFITKAKRFQDVIGEHQDAVVAEERLRDLRRSARGASTAFALGRLVERQGRRRERSRSELPTAWEKLEGSGRKAWT
jgi:CHAD domain-containing protein/adenylate cyclase class IV